MIRGTILIGALCFFDFARDARDEGRLGVTLAWLVAAWLMAAVAVGA